MDEYGYDRGGSGYRRHAIALVHLESNRENSDLFRHNGRPRIEIPISYMSPDIMDQLHRGLVRTSMSDFFYIYDSRTGIKWSVSERDVKEVSSRELEHVAERYLSLTRGYRPRYGGLVGQPSYTETGSKNTASVRFDSLGEIGPKDDGGGVSPLPQKTTKELNPNLFNVSTIKLKQDDD